MKVRIVGFILDPNQENLTCVLSGEIADGYIEHHGQMVPCKLSLLGPGEIGQSVEVPKELEQKLKF